MATRTEEGNNVLRTRILVVVTMAVGLAAPTASAVASTATMPPVYKNCTALNKKYPHGVGKASATDKVKGSTQPVANFYRNTRLYKVAMSHNKRLDRDKDGIACEEP